MINKNKYNMGRVTATACTNYCRPKHSKRVKYWVIKLFKIINIPKTAQNNTETPVVSGHILDSYVTLSCILLGSVTTELQLYRETCVVSGHILGSYVSYIQHTARISYH